MQAIKKILAIMTMFMFSLNCYATAANYVGIDYNVRLMQGRDRYNYMTSEVFPETYHGYEVYAAHRFANDVGLGIGWEQTAFSDNSYVFKGQQNFINATQTAGNVARVQSRVEVIHFDLLGYFNITDNWEALGEMGLGLTRVTMNAYLRSGGINYNLMPSNNFDNLVPRAGFGLQYFLPWCIGIRAMFNWQGMVVYNMSFLDEDGTRTKIKPFDQSWIFSLGIVGKFKL